METTLSNAEKVLALREIEIFAGLSLAELTAVASVTEEVTRPGGAAWTHEDEFGDGLCLILAGEVIVEHVKPGDTDRATELTRVGSGEALGLPALFGEPPPEIGMRTDRETRLLRLSRDEFEAVVKEYPGVALHICRVLSRRLGRAVARVAKPFQPEKA